MRRGIIAMMALSLTGCAALLGQPSITPEQLIQLMQAPKSTGCAQISGAYPPVAPAVMGNTIVKWGDDPPKCERSSIER